MNITSFPYKKGDRLRKCWKTGLWFRQSEMVKINGHWMCKWAAKMENRDLAAKRKRTFPTVTRVE